MDVFTFRHISFRGQSTFLLQWMHAKMNTHTHTHSKACYSIAAPYMQILHQMQSKRRRRKLTLRFEDVNMQIRLIYFINKEVQFPYNNASIVLAKYIYIYTYSYIHMISNTWKRTSFVINASVQCMRALHTLSLTHTIACYWNERKSDLLGFD